MDYPNRLNFGTCGHGTSYHLAEGCECQGCMVDDSARPALAAHGWTLTEDRVWVKGRRRICDETGSHSILGGAQ